MNLQSQSPVVSRSLTALGRVSGLRYFALASWMLAGTAVAVEPKHDYWSRFRGPNGTGIVQECTAPLPWSEADIRWETSLPGKGNGSPCVYGNRVFLMSADADTAERHLLAFDLETGAKVWHERKESQPYHVHARSSFASCTPCANESAVFFAWATPDNVALLSMTHDGQELWRKDLGRYVSQHGFGSSPALFGNILILFNSQAAEQLPPGVAPGESRVMAFDAATGETLWETPRTTTRTCYGLPRLFTDVSGVEALLFCNTGDGIFALELATGKPLWNNKVFSKRCVSSPIIVGDIGFGSEGSGGGGNVLYGVSLKGDHEVKIKVDRSAPYVPTPVAKGDLLFLWGDTGIVSCIRTPSGETVWSKRIGGNVSTSPVIVGDRLMGIAEDGTVTILAASDKFEELGKIKLEDTTRATPAVGADFVLVRTDTRLICVGK